MDVREGGDEMLPAIEVRVDAREVRGAVGSMVPLSFIDGAKSAATSASGSLSCTNLAPPHERLAHFLVSHVLHQHQHDRMVRTV